MLVVWGLLVPFAALAFERLRANVRARRWISIGLVPTMLYVPYAVAGATLEGAMFWPTPRELVATSRWIDASTAPSTWVAIDPKILDSSWGYWLRRRLWLGDRRHALLFGATGTAYDATASLTAASVSSLREGPDCSPEAVPGASALALVTARSGLPLGSARAAAWPRDGGPPTCLVLARSDSGYDVWLDAAAQQGFESRPGA